VLAPFLRFLSGTRRSFVTMISAAETTPRKRRWRNLSVFLGSSTLLHLTLLPLLIALLGLRLFAPSFQPEVYHVSSSAIRLEHRDRPMPHAIPQRRAMPQLRHVIEPREVARELQPKEAQPKEAQPTPPPVRVAYRAPVHVTPTRIAPHQQIDPKTLAQQERMYAATIAAAQAANNPLSISKTERSPTAISRVNYNVVGSEAPSRRGDGIILYPVKRWVQGRLVFYFLRYTVHYPSGDYEAGDVPWPVHYTVGADPFAQGLSEHIPLPGPAPDFVASADTLMKPLIAHCYRLREQYCEIMPSPQ